ncbi:hypothetical protein ADN00_12785 [Ornatilinea apprima]|uniref:Thiamine pyrophosphate enzyme central domain-containing protein n=1 Tax=Ornatilinea apprima TaxID=1134406 RepID=A0A0P6XIV9_9CHLR|nr:thiamine pyrophosphate-binding protein [Ornatilinea apprima]KPL75517.1 hypothetical protein ADN00_12785 [Ornatilinea apprima]
MPFTNGWEAFTTALKSEKIQFVFSPPTLAGGLRAALGQEPALRLVAAAQPAQMALGCALASGEPAVCLGSLPDLLPALAQARESCAPLLAVCLDDPTGADAGGAAKWTDRVSSPQQIPWSLRRAFSLAANGQPGPVLLHLPPTVAGVQAEISAYQPAQRGIRSSGDLARVIAAAFLLVEAKNPVLLAGVGALRSNAGDDARALAELLGMPVLTTSGGRGILPEDHPLSLGWASAAAQNALQAADLVLTVGAREVEHRPGPRWIQIDIDSFELGRDWLPDLPILGDAKLVLADILSAILSEVQPKPEWQIRGAHWARVKLQSEAAALAADPPGALTPAAALSALRQAMGRETTLLYETGSPYLSALAAPHYPVDEPAGVLPLARLDWAAMQGAQAARPTWQMVAVHHTLPVGEPGPASLPAAGGLLWVALCQPGGAASPQALARLQAAGLTVERVSRAEDLPAALAALRGKAALLEITLKE